MTQSIATGYILGVIFLLLRLILMTARAHRLSAIATQICDGPAFEVLEALRRRWSMKAVPLLSSVEGIIIPHVTGLLRPVILLPASTLTSTPIDDLEVILLHELAHIRRFDLWVHLVQRLAEIVLFFNPATWYLSQRITTLREYCWPWSDNAFQQCRVATCVWEPWKRFDEVMLPGPRQSGP